MTAPVRHVFVDTSGRRQTWLHRGGWALAAVIAAYLILLVAALVGPPGLSRLAVPGLREVLPDTGAARLGDAEGGSGTPQDVLEQVTARPTPTATPRSAGPRPTATGVSATGAPVPSATQPGGRPSTPPGQASPTAGATTTAAPGNKPTDQPTPRGTGKPTRTPRP